MKTQTKKIIRDMLQEKGRTFAVIIAITLAVFSIAMISTSYFLLNRDMKTNYLRTNPASATFLFESAGKDVLEKVKEYPGVADAELSRMVVGRVEMEKDSWIPIWLFVKSDFNNQKIHLMKQELGKTVPSENEVLIERNALVVMKKKIGDTITVKSPNGTKKALKISGVVHDPGQAPAWMEHTGYGYVTADALKYLGLAPNFNKVDFTVKENPFDKEKIVLFSVELKKRLAEKGYHVLQTDVKEPGVHPHATQMKSFIYMEAALCIVLLFLSAFIITTMITALMAKQIRQIGIMKAIGGNNSQILSIYLGIVFILSGIGICLGLPLGLKMGYLSVGFAASQLNINILNYSLPHIVIVLQLLISIIIPLLVTIYPVYRSSKITIREALIDYGIPTDGTGTGFFEKQLYKIQGSARTLMLSIRNTFRKKARLILTLLTLSIAGGLFISTIVMRESMLNTINIAFSAWKYDLNISFFSRFKTDEMIKTIKSIPEVQKAECWGEYPFTRVYENGSESHLFQLSALSPASEMLDLELLEGRWLNKNDTDSIVINNRMLYANSRGKLNQKNVDIRVGDRINCKINNKIYSFKVVGVVKEVFNFGAAFINYDYFSGKIGDQGYAQNLRVILKDGNEDFKSSINRKVESLLAAKGYNIAGNLQTYEMKGAVNDHFKMLVGFLSFMTILVLIVGAISLITIMSINVVERTHELGILKAIGASNAQITWIIMLEGITIGIISWVLAILFSIPVSYLFSSNIAVLFIQTTADYVFNPGGVIIWLMLSIVLSGVASLFPARRVLKLSAHDTLSYE